MNSILSIKNIFISYDEQSITRQVFKISVVKLKLVALNLIKFSIVNSLNIMLLVLQRGN